MRKLAVVALGLGISCSFKSPQAPSWQTRLNVPLVDRIYTVAEMVKNQENVVFDENGRLGFHIEENIDATRIGENFKLDGFTQSFQVGLTDLETPAFNVSYDRFYFQQMCPATAGQDGKTMVVNTTVFQRLAGEKHTDPNFHSASIAKGLGKLHIYNRLPVALENVTLQLRDSDSGNMIVNSPRLAGLAAGDSTIIEVLLDGVRIPDNNQWLISGTIKGSTAAVAVRSNQVVDIVTQIDKVRMSRLDARIPSIGLMIKQTIELLPAMTITVEELAFQKGAVTLTLDNKTPFGSGEVALQLDQVKDAGTGMPLAFNISLQPFQKTTNVLNLNNYVAKLDLPRNGAQQLLNVTVSGSTQDLSDHFVSLDEKSTITATINFSDLVIDHLSGRLAEQQVVLDTVKKSVDLPDRLNDLDNVRFGQATLTMDIYNTVQLPIRFEGKLWAFNEKGDKAFLSFDQAIKPGGTGEVLTRLPVFTAQNSDMVKFMDIRPNQFVATGRAWVGDGVTYGQIKASDYIRAQVAVDVPAQVSWTAKDFHIDTTQVEIKPVDEGGDLFDNGDLVRISGDATDNLVSAKITAKIENHLPVGGSVQLLMAEALQRLYDKPNVVLDAIKLPAAVTDVAGKVIASRYIEVTLQLTDQDMELLKNSGATLKPVFIAADLKLDGSNNEERQIFSNDYVKIQALLTLEVLVKEKK
jgi:hypothetical protein